MNPDQSSRPPEPPVGWQARATEHNPPASIWKTPAPATRDIWKRIAEDIDDGYGQYLHRALAQRGLNTHDGVLTAQHHEWVQKLINEQAA